MNADQRLRERGFALLIVLWTLVFLAFLMSQILATGRTATALAANTRAVAEARAAADGAVNEAMFHVVARGADHWGPDGSLHNLGGVIAVSVRIDSLAGRINPNLASAGLLGGLLQAVGASSGQAGQLAGAITQWRSPAATKEKSAAALAAYRRAGYLYGPPGHSFTDVSELGDVLGMPPALLAKAIPEMSLDQTGAPDPALADPVVRRALALSGQAGAGSSADKGPVPVVSILAQATMPGGVVARRVAVVSVSGGNLLDPIRVISLTDD